MEQYIYLTLVHGTIYLPNSGPLNTVISSLSKVSSSLKKEPLYFTLFYEYTHNLVYCLSMIILIMKILMVLFVCKVF